MDDRVMGQQLVKSGLVGREVTRVILDHAVTLQFSAVGSATMELKLETSFELVDGLTTRAIEPERLSENAAAVVSLFGKVVVSVELGLENDLHIEFAGGPSVRAPKHGEYESWSFVSDAGDRVICLPSGELAIWNGPVRRHN